MSDLNQIVGAILRDITKARVSSDMYSREAYRAFKDDQILQHFPVPRMDISSMEIDLKLAISRANSSLEDIPDKSKSLYDEILAFTKEITQIFVDEYIRLLSISTIIPLNTTDLEEIKKKQKNSVYMYNFADNTAQKLFSSLNELVDIALDNKVVRNSFRDKLFDKIQCELSNSIFCNELKNILVKNLISEVQKDKIQQSLKEYFDEILIGKLKSKIVSQSDKLSDIYDKENILNVHIAVTTEELKDIPESKISSLKLVLNLQNYLISSIETDGEEFFSIRPE